MFYHGYSKSNLEKAIELLSVEKDSNELSYSMFRVFISNLKTIDTKEQAIPLLENEILRLREKLAKAKNYNSEYYIEENINDCIESILEIYLLLHEYEKGIKYFHKNYIEHDKEVKEYILLEKLEDLNLIKEWLKEYESYMNNIEFRNSLVEKYNKFKNNL